MDIDNKSCDMGEGKHLYLSGNIPPSTNRNYELQQQQNSESEITNINTEQISTNNNKRSFHTSDQNELVNKETPVHEYHSTVVTGTHLKCTQPMHG